MESSTMVEYACSSEQLRPFLYSNTVRWLSPAQDMEIHTQFLASFGFDLTCEDWESWESDGYRYCGVISEGEMLARGAVYTYSEDKWMVAAISTKLDCRNRGHAKVIVSFLTEYIHSHSRIATCSTLCHNIPMRRVLEVLGYQLMTPAQDVDA